jgi:NAD(P)H-dependent glutamate synthase small subunit|tara:strand:- start:5010 stop:6461 length:1452 start_codon:yes stop_codon:yes gene_type:complete
MSKLTGFKEFEREAEGYRTPADRLIDFKEIFAGHEETHLQVQSARCMDCGVPFCQSDQGCPIVNLIPEWNDQVYQARWQDALDRLQRTNNFPEFTGRVCPAPCEGACVLGVTEDPVTIKNMECAIIDRGFDEGWVVANPPGARTGKSVAVVGSGPAGLAAAAQLNSVGHDVTVYERADRVGGLLMYGIPNMKLDKSVVTRRVELLRAEGVRFIVNADVGGRGDTGVDVAELLEKNDALLLTTGATIPRDMSIRGRDASGIHFAMELLQSNTKSLLDSNHADGQFISCRDKDVIVIGGGDTGTDCIGTALRHGCKSIVNFEILPKPPAQRAADNPWPRFPILFTVDYGHAEASHTFGEDPRVYSITGKEFVTDGAGKLLGITTLGVDTNLQTIAGTEKTWQADLIFLAMGFLGPEHYISDSLGLVLDQRSTYQAAYGQYKTSIPKVYAAGDCRRGQSLVVWAINEGREAAREIDLELMGSTQLP